MPDHAAHQGPLHLQSYLTECGPELAKALAQSVEHPVSSLCGLACPCRPSPLARVLEEHEHAGDPGLRRIASQRLAALREHQRKRAATSTVAAPAVGSGDAATPAGKHDPCRLFGVEINEEAGVVRAHCRRCQRLFILFDRALYWGLPRDVHIPPQTWPYRCACGGHSFELGLGFDYDDDAIDENDLHTVTVAVRCAACDQVALVLDEEG